MDKYKIETNWIKWSSVSLNLVLCFVLLRGCDINRCADNVVTEVRYDTIYRDTTYQLALNNTPKVKYRKRGGFKSDTTLINSDRYSSSAIDSIWIVTNTSNPDTCIYNDTIREDGKFKAVLIELVAGEIISRRFYWANLVPEITKTTTVQSNDKLSPIAVYAGIQTGYSVRYNKLLAAPSAMLSFQRIGLNAAYSYDIVSNAHLIGAWAKIRFK